MKTRTYQAPAKINLCLHVLGKREDGYHNLAMLMQQVSLFDTLRVSLGEGDDVRARCPGLELADGEENIAARAARLLLDHVGLKRRVDIVIEKRIPAAAGLGGGSSDAATVLMGLNELLELGLPTGELIALGVRIGADVPFFLYGQTAWATGVGERLEPWAGLPPVWFVLVNPNVPVSTAWVFQNLGLTHSGAVAKIPRFPERAQELVGLLHNDLETVTCRRHPVIDTIKTSLLDQGAIGALMSGSGPTVFGIFGEQGIAEEAARALAEEAGWWAVAVSPV